MASLISGLCGRNLSRNEWPPEWNTMHNVSVCSSESQYSSSVDSIEAMSSTCHRCHRLKSLLLLLYAGFHVHLKLSTALTTPFCATVLLLLLSRECFLCLRSCQSFQVVYANPVGPLRPRWECCNIRLLVGRRLWPQPGFIGAYVGAPLFNSTSLPAQRASHSEQSAREFLTRHVH